MNAHLPTASPRPHLVWVPFNAAGVASGVALMPQAIAGTDLRERLRDDVGLPSDTWIPIAEPVAERGPSGLLNEHALTQMIAAVADTLDNVWSRSELPIVIAGDCPVLLAPLLRFRGRRGGGLVFVDGHEDAWAPTRSPSGEASDCELGIALGLHAGPVALEGSLDCLEREHTLVLGPRDSDELAAAGEPSLAGLVEFVSGESLTDAAGYSHLPALVAMTAGLAPAGWWLHVDLDVLSTSALSAVDYPQTGGISWAQLAEITQACLSVPGCQGMSVVIYNPDLDSGRAAEEISAYVANATRLLCSTSPS